MEVLLSRMQVLPGALVLLVLSVFSHGSTVGPSQIIDTHGRHIASVFNGVSPNLRYARAFSQMMKTGGTSPSPCTLVRKAVFRESDHIGRLLKVQVGCGAHDQVEEIRNCGSSCGGCSENWTYSDSLIATWCDGYIIDY